jgi:hypothetical protein
MISAGLGHPAKRVFRRTTREASLFGRLSLTAPISCPHRVRVQERTAVGRIEKFFSEWRVRSWQ